MRIIGERNDGSVAVQIRPNSVVVYHPKHKLATPPQDVCSVKLDQFSKPVDDSWEARRAMQRNLDRATVRRP